MSIMADTNNTCSVQINCILLTHVVISNVKISMLASQIMWISRISKSAHVAGSHYRTWTKWLTFPALVSSYIEALHTCCMTCALMCYLLLVRTHWLSSIHSGLQMSDQNKISRCLAATQQPSDGGLHWPTWISSQIWIRPMKSDVGQAN